MSDESTFDATKIQRPDPTLFHYYVIVSLLTGPIFPFVLIPLWLRYATLQYKFDESGVSMQWGVFFRREVYLTYRRIQDIQLTRNLLQRWMGLAKISLQTASGSSHAEMSIEGVLQADELRSYLYSRMRGAKNESGASVSSTQQSTTEIVSEAHLEQSSHGSDPERVTRALEETRDA